MHYHLEIIMPPTEDVAPAVAQIMAPFDEDGSDEYLLRYAFWDWYQIGGRWSGHKMLARFQKDRIDAFYAAMKEQHVTVSGVRAGKPTLQPATQIEMVDRMWSESFPEFPGKSCPLFDHYKDDHGDVCKLSEIQPDLSCNHLIIAALDHEGNVRAQHIMNEKIWNGVSYEKTMWDGTIAAALVDFSDYCQRAGEEYRKRSTPQPDWLVVTVDYHS